MPDEEIIEMEKGNDGKYRVGAVVKVSKRRKLPVQKMPVRNSTYRNLNPGPIASRFYQFMEGFEIGLDAVERFFDVMGRYDEKKME